MNIKISKPVAVTFWTIIAAGYSFAAGCLVYSQVARHQIEPGHFHATLQLRAPAQQHAGKNAQAAVDTAGEQNETANAHADADDATAQ